MPDDEVPLRGNPPVADPLTLLPGESLDAYAARYRELLLAERRQRQQQAFDAALERARRLREYEVLQRVRDEVRRELQGPQPMFHDSRILDALLRPRVKLTPWG
jgi:hypothetical protein